jgi:hypothetical protein
MPTPRPVWGADCRVSMPLPPAEPIVVDMGGFAMTQYRMVHSINQATYQALSVPVYAPASGLVAHDDAAIDQASTADNGNL